jgi:hypothetical protein
MEVGWVLLIDKEFDLKYNNFSKISFVCFEQALVLLCG